MNNSRLPMAAAFAMTVSALFAPPPAQAVSVTRVTQPNAAALCQGALPQFAGTLRARPLAIMNEGATSAFVTCSFSQAIGFGNGTTTDAGVSVINRGGTAAAVTCTLVNGFESAGGPHPITSYTPKSVAVLPGSGSFISWIPANLPGDPDVISNPNLSCILPPATGIAYLQHHYSEEIGQ